MSNAPLPAGLPTQTHHGIGARFFHRVTGAVRSAITRITRPARRRRQAVLPAGTTPSTSRQTPSSQPQASSPAAEPQQPARSGWSARRCGAAASQSARPGRRRRFRNVRFAPESCPGLTAAQCAFLNTPVEECDPEVVRLLLTGIAERIADLTAGRRGAPDAPALFAALWAPLADMVGQARADAEPVVASEPVAAPPEPPPAPAPDEPPTTPAQPEPRAASRAPSRRPPPPRPDGAGERAAPDRAGPANPGSDRRKTVNNRNKYRNRWHRRRAPCPAAMRNAPQRLPARRLSYAACAGPP